MHDLIQCYNYGTNYTYYMFIHVFSFSVAVSFSCFVGVQVRPVTVLGFT